jgi:chromosome segregation ATPase
MEIEDLAKKIDWLEKEHRKDRATISEFQEKLVGFEGNTSLLQNQIKELNSDLSRYKSTGARLDQFDSMVTQYRAEVTKSIDEMEKRRTKHEHDIEERRRMEVDVINKSLIEVRTGVASLQELRRGLKERVDEDIRLAHAFGELEKKLDEFSHADEEIRRSVRSVDEARRYDIKRIADIQGEQAAIRKRAEDAREKSELNSDSLHQLDSRINELLASETDRRQAQLAFIEQQSLATVERERGWKEIQARFEGFNRQNAIIDQQLIALEDTQRSVKRSQEAFDEMNTRIERRINEITEIQRLTEERFRQEWVTLKADDQKRWTNYTLTQDDWVKDIRTEQEKLSQRITILDDEYQSLQDLIQQTTETTETQLQELMNWAHEFLTNYERITGRSRPTR